MRILQAPETEKIVLTSHKLPDMDAVASILALYLILQDNCPEKQVIMILEDPVPEKYHPIIPQDILAQILIQPLQRTLSEAQPDSIVLLDCNNYTRVSRGSVQETIFLLASTNTKTLIIDHHKSDGREFEIVESFTNHQGTSTTEEIYRLANESAWKISTQALTFILAGIITDTHNFQHTAQVTDLTHEIIAKSKDLGLPFDEIIKAHESITPGQREIITELERNLQHTESANYSYMDSNFLTLFKEKYPKLTESEYDGACAIFADQHISAQPNYWGFILYPDFKEANLYRGKFRSSRPQDIDTSVYAKRLNGGGHAYAAAFSLKAPCMEDAIAKVIAVTMFPDKDECVLISN